MKKHIQQISFLEKSPVEKAGNFTARSEASLRVLEALTPSTTEATSSSSKSSMSSTVSSFSWVVSKDSDLDTLDRIGDGGKTEGMETATGGTAETGTVGGGLLGGEPEDSGSVTK